MFRICKQMFKVEDLVVVTGLKKDKDLNGAMGIVVGHAPDKVDKSITRHKVRKGSEFALPQAFCLYNFFAGSLRPAACGALSFQGK